MTERRPTMIGINWQFANPEPWTKHALCAQIGDDLWYPEAGISAQKAKAICGSREHPNCPVREECLAYALTHDERYGVWGGFSERERRQMMRDPRGPTFRPLCGTRAALNAHAGRGEPPCDVCRAVAAERSRIHRTRNQQQ